MIFSRNMVQSRQSKASLVEREVAERSEVGGIVLYKHNKDMVSYARTLRKNMTKEEKHLWYDFLREYPVKFTRQKIIGAYIVDFYCPQADLVIELDGSQHFEEDVMKKDTERTTFLEQFHLTVFRIPNSEINSNFQGVCEQIDLLVRQSLSHAARA